MKKQARRSLIWEPFRQKDLGPKPQANLPKPASQAPLAPPAPPFPWRYVGTLQTDRGAVFLFLQGEELSHLWQGESMGPWQFCEIEAEDFVFKAPPDYIKRVPR